MRKTSKQNVKQHRLCNRVGASQCTRDLPFGNLTFTLRHVRRPHEMPLSQVRLPLHEHKHVFRVLERIGDKLT